MNKFTISVLLICLATNYAIAQKAKVQTAYNYLKYDQLDKAKATIDEAVQSEQSKNMERAWYVRGLIYMSLFNNEKFGSLCEHCMVTADESFQKAVQINSKNEWADSSKLKQTLLKFFLFNDGVQKFNTKEYARALDDFEQAIQITPNDTSAVVNSAISADKAGNKLKARIYYQKLVDMKAGDNNIYLSLSNLYKEEKDTSKALDVIREGRKNYPDSLNLMIAEINLLIPTGKSKEATEVIESAIVKDPANADLYLALGNMYDNLANPKTTPPTRSLNYSEYINKAEQAYLKGLQYKADKLELNYNLGALYFNQAAEYYNAASNLPLDQEKKHQELMNKSKETFRKAQPYLEKANQIRPDDKDILSSLKELYYKTDQEDKAKAIENK